MRIPMLALLALTLALAGCSDAFFEADHARVMARQRAGYNTDAEDAAALGGLTTFMNGWNTHQQPRMTTCQPVGNGNMLSCY